MSHRGNARPEVIPYVPMDVASVLDVGCSDGLFAAELKRQRPEVSVDGVEPDEEAAGSARPRLRELFAGTFPEAVPSDGRYDCVTFLDCLEHLVDPWGALRHARGLLSEGGVVVASLPNIRHVSALETVVRRRDWPWDDEGIFDRTHLRAFTAVSMRRLFETSGFSVTTCEPINEWNNVKTRVLARFLGQDIKATQFVLVAQPA